MLNPVVDACEEAISLPAGRGRYSAFMVEKQKLSGSHTCAGTKERALARYSFPIKIEPASCQEGHKRFQNLSHLADVFFYLNVFC